MTSYGIFNWTWGYPDPTKIVGDFPDADTAVQKLETYQAVNPNADTWYVSAQCSHGSAEGQCLDCADEERGDIDYDYVCSYHEDEPDECQCAPGF